MDSICKDYQKYICYERMGERSKERFDELAEEYGRLLNKGSAYKETIYTLHDFDHHCRDMYRIISNIILSEERLDLLTEEELYLLNLSVLFHDISMSQGGRKPGSGKNHPNYEPTMADRRIHALQSAEWLEAEYKNKQSCLGKGNKLTRAQLSILKALCRAHCEPEGDEYNPAEYGLSDRALNPPTKTAEGKVRQKALAAILRLADSLDVCYDRLGDADEETMLEAQTNSEDAGIAKKGEESQQHWRRLYLFEGLKKESNSKLFLEIDIVEVRGMIASDEYDDILSAKIKNEIKNDILFVTKSIQDTLTDTWKKVFDAEESAAGLITIREVDYYSDDPRLLDELGLSKEQKLFDVGKNDEIVKVPADKSPQREIHNALPTIMNAKLAAAIKHKIDSDRLFTFGDYQLNNCYCTRSWIATTKMMKDKILASQIIAEMFRHIHENFGQEEYELIGLDVVGSTIAARLAFCMQKPMSYVIPAHLHGNADPHEVDVPPDVSASEKIIIITDSIITGETLGQTLKNRKWEDKILAIYSIFYRPSIRFDKKIISPPVSVEKMFTLNTDFPAEIIPIENCPFGYSQKDCRADNKPI